jgi:hypothetical protein
MIITAIAVENRWLIDNIYYVFGRQAKAPSFRTQSGLRVTLTAFVSLQMRTSKYLSSGQYYR